MRIALTGGIACGKSLVARFLNEQGVETLDADDLVHELLPDPAERRRIAAEVFADPEKRKALEARLHPLVKEKINAFLEEGQDQRSTAEDPVLRPSSFALRPSSSALRPSSSALRPSSFALRPSSFALRPSPFALRPSSFALRLAIIPLLFEVHWDSDYDIICCVASDEEKQLSRMTATRGYTREEAEARLAAQLPVRVKVAKSHYVIENNGSVEELESKVAEFVEWLKEKG